MMTGKQITYLHKTSIAILGDTFTVIGIIFVDTSLFSCSAWGSFGINRLVAYYGNLSPKTLKQFLLF